MNHILVTGATGLLGREVFRLLLARSDVRVTGIGRRMLSDDFGAMGFYVPVDLSSDWSNDVIPDDVDTIIHLAQSPHYRSFPKSALDVFNVNVRSTARLLDLARQRSIKRFIYASSGGIYRNSGVAFTENAALTHPGELGYYLGGKAACESMVQSYAAEFDVTIVRPFFIYGRGQNRGMLIPRLYDKISMLEPVDLVGFDGIKINPIHVEDAARALVQTIWGAKSMVYNLAGSEVLTLRQVCCLIAEYLDVEPSFNSVVGVPQDLVADVRKMKEELHVPLKRFGDCLFELDPVSMAAL